MPSRQDRTKTHKGRRKLGRKIRKRRRAHRLKLRQRKTGYRSSK